ncbi:uncharacterized protein LOC116296239 [Actinia tenebrosa]|uniref:Uncharacterized protein LOC116296239 n=1 Tax=Actinia tenebrosa TaxID=6105 RepID=A0A6P8HXG2_ACTTE|nr:uncharacterized protein LOC116296239 [Actinia tenebrosa]
MSVRRTVFVALLLRVLSEVVAGKIRCKYDEFVVEDVVRKISCVPCKNCSVGEGLSPQCGSFIPYGTHIECKPCVSGVSYSSTYSIESCQPCGICVDHQKVLQKCNRTSNSICAENCDVGFYLSSVVGDCQECSWCCPDSDPSEHEAECKKDGVPIYKRCSVDESIRCSPRCTDRQYIIVANNLNQSCYDCPYCGVGQGLYPKCQSVLSSTKDSKCQQCIPGKTYSDTIDSSSCKPCKVCGVGKKIERSCNTTHDTLCGVCDRGFYNESIEGNKEVNCQHCSYCCGDDEDVIIPECKAQGLPKNRQCAYTKRALTKCVPAHKSLYKIVAIVLALIIILIGAIIGVYAYKVKCLGSKYGKLVSDESQMDSAQVVVLDKEAPSPESTPNNIEFRHSGIIVQCHDVGTGEILLRDLTVKICWNEHKHLPKRKEIYLSPLIQFHSPECEIETAITLDIPHSAYLQEENNTWKIKILKLALPIKPETEIELTELSGDPEIKVHPCSVTFTVKELAAYVVVGDPGDPQRAKKRMQCAVFGAVPKTGKTYSTMIYLLDDGESSLKKLQQDEKNEGRHLLKKLFCSLYPDVDAESVIDVAIKNVMEGWQQEDLSKKVIRCSEWLDSYQAIPNIKASFKHIDPQIRDFRCTFKLTFKDHVVEIPIFHFSEPEHIPIGIQPTDHHAPPDDLHISINESRTPMHSYQYQSLSSVPNEVLTNISQSVHQAIGEDHSRIVSVATKIFTADEVDSISKSDQPINSLIDLARNKSVTVADVHHALKEEGLESGMLLPFLHEENSTQLV